MKYIIPRNASIGAASAEHDDEFFSECFLDTGLIDQMIKSDASKPIMVGRTGSGKSAIIRQLADKQKHVFQIAPESLSLNFLADSWLIGFLSKNEVDLGLFYQQLWRHVLIVELLKYEKGLETRDKTKSFICAFTNLFRDNSRKEQAFSYLASYAGEFWEDTEQRVKQISENFERDVEGELGVNYKKTMGRIKSGEKLSKGETTEVLIKARKIVNKTQMQQLAQMIDILDEDVFNDRQKKVVLLIDDLDQQWADDSIKIKLIESLFNVLPKFRKITNVKMIVAMRDDLLDIVLNQTSTPGFQRDKFEDQYARIKWSKNQLKDVVDKRINKMFRSKYTNETVSYEDIMPKEVSKQTSFDYICDRTMMRPRDIIAYFNILFLNTAEKSEITQKDIKSVELNYSVDRRRALVDEWKSRFPYIDDLINFLGNRKLSSEFRLGNIDNVALDELILILATKYQDISDDLINLCNSFFNGGTDLIRDNIRIIIISTLYRIGALGIKTQVNSRMQFGFVDRPIISGSELNDNTPCLVHPMLWQALSRRGESKDLF